MKITVAQEDIDRARYARYERPRHIVWVQPGVRESAAPAPYDSEQECPIAQALLRLGYAKVRVHPDYLTGYRALDWAAAPDRFYATAAIRTAMRQWDRHGRFAPRTFMLRAY